MSFGCRKSGVARTSAIEGEDRVVRERRDERGERQRVNVREIAVAQR